MLAEFEEKQYEQHLNIELLHGSNLIFPPGQHLENILGFDAAVFTRNGDFWKNFQTNYSLYRRIFRRYPSGMYFPKGAFELSDIVDNDFPNFKFNAFIQHKRPERMVKETASEWHCWGKNYYRYKLDEHQQAVLEEIEKHVGDNGVVTYASPAFHTNQEFWDAQESKSFVRLSNFCQPIKLTGHNTYTYVSAGTSGLAHSQPESVESKNPIEEIERLSQAENNGNTTNSKFISKTCELIEASLKNHEKMISLYNHIVNNFNYPSSETGLIRNLYKLRAFTFVSGINLYFGVKNKY